MFVAGLVATATIVLVLMQRNRALEVGAMSQQAEHVAAGVSENLELAVANVRSLQAFFEASAEVTSYEFSRFAIHQTASPGQIASGYAEVVPAGRLEAWASAREAERSWFQVVGVDRRPIDMDGRADDPVVALYRHEYDVMPSVLGVDLASEPRRRRSLTQAIHVPGPVLTDFVTGAGEDPGPYVEIYMGVGHGVGTADGVVFAILDVAALANSSRTTPVPGVTVELADVSHGEVVDPIRRPRLWVDDIDVEGRRWSVEVSSDRSLRDTTLLLGLPAAGLVISLLAAALTTLVASSRSRERELEILRRGTDEKDLFLASVAHELRTPLTGVVGMTAVLSEGWREMDDGDVDELLEVAHSEAADMSDLIEDLLVAGRLEAGAIAYKGERVDIAAEVDRVTTRVAPRQHLLLRLSESGPFVRADSLRFRQIVRNLMVNASRYGKSVIEAEARHVSGSIVLEVRNDGLPIPPLIAKTLFEPYRAARQRPGQPGSIGLGLHISRTLARAMNGDLIYTYRDGRCVFSVVLPEWSEPAPLSPALDQSNTTGP